ncbi:MAG: hypothetical protein A3J63_01120 [Candidatus Moranbacteria bacterium RIFCSPHIGHO2_02_FULL_40_12b]|nr:MAG: hypothetical protein A3J63_01120 [Candidatus Moranbacteria bacterium RIFCSPHIGHO2_02_FULL_40_12b]
MKILSNLKNTEFWCSNCDAKKVHSEKPETGRFYYQFGHLWDVKNQKISEEYTQVIFAFCSNCAPEEKICSKCKGTGKDTTSQSEFCEYCDNGKVISFLNKN